MTDQPATGTSADSLLQDEVRLAMAWNGGVSLAVWMGGGAVEFDCARRADLGPELDVRQPRVVYNALLKAFERKLVVDIIAGASAGGLNGALLAGAITRGRRLSPKFLRDAWLNLGDFADLLQPTSEPKPSSLMQGELFRTRLITALRALLGEVDVDMGDPVLEDATIPDAADVSLTNPLESQTTANRGDAPRNDVILEVQVTDVTGEQQGFADAWQQVLYAREYRTPVRFEQTDDYTALTLATAARASSSFPSAFEPQVIDGATAALAGLTGERRYAVDGGLLENAPIKAALDLIPLQSSETLARRVLCYVNAAPTQQATDPPATTEPTLRDVLGYVINLPRIAREVDQLTAIKNAVQSGRVAADVVDSLLGLNRGSLLDTAGHLLPAYQKARALASLEELVSTAPGADSTALADGIFDRISSGPRPPRLPWIPDDITVSDDPRVWRWGFRAAQRVLRLELDLLDRGLKPNKGEAGPPFSHDELRQILDARHHIYAELRALEVARRKFLKNPFIRAGTAGLSEAADVEGGLASLDEIMNQQGFRPVVLKALRDGTNSFYKALRIVSRRGDALLTTTHLFDLAAETPELNDPGFNYFVETALAIEVVRRAFSPGQDIESSQQLSFAQLTPYVPCKVMTNKPFQKDGPTTSDDKLVGVLFAHFGGFYRRSWRANDFMWGRLDAATRIVDLIVGLKRGSDLAQGADSAARWLQLAEALVPSGDEDDAEDRRWLVEEALDDAAATAIVGTDIPPGAVRANKLVLPAELTGRLRARPYTASRTALVETLAEVIEADQVSGTGLFTRVVCARAAQYEILRDELPSLVAETGKDVTAGAYTAALDWKTDGSLREALTALRDYRRTGRSLPALLGRFSSEESASTLAMRTLSHAALVVIAALPAATIPLARVFSVARPPFLSIFGISSKGWLPRLAVVAVFAASSMYVTARVITASPLRAPDGSGYSVPLGALWALPALVMWLAALAALGVAVVPVWRGMRSSPWWRVVHLGVAAALALLWGVVAVWLASREFGFGSAITAWRGFEPPSWALWTVFSIALGAPLIIRHLPIPGPLQARVESLATKWISRANTTSIGALAAAVLLIVYSADPLSDRLCGFDWRAAAASCSLASIVVCAVYVFTVPRLWKGAKTFTAAARSSVRRAGVRLGISSPRP